MPRLFTSDELALALGDGVNHHLYVFVADADGAMQDCSDLGDLHLDMLDGSSFGESLDTPVSTGTLVIRRDTTFDSAAPTIGDSSINRNALGDYAPLFEKGRAIEMRYAITAQGVAPTSGQIRPLFIGRIDAVHWHDNPMTVDISDIGAWLADAQIRESKQYADSTGVPGTGPLLGEMIQNMIDDAMPDSGIVLNAPVTSPFQPFSDKPQDPGSLLQAARNWALEIGWDLRYRWTDTDTFLLTLFEPPRDKVDPDWTLGPNDYSKVNNLTSSIADVRNDIIVQFKDDDGALQTVEVRNEASITKYGGPGAVPRLWFIPTTAIRNATDATAFATAVNSDLSEPDVDQEIALPFFPFVQIGDLGLFEANDDHYDSDQLLAVVGYQHHFEKGEGQTTIQVRGKVAGAYRAWIRRPGAAPGIPATPTVARPSITPFIHDDTHAVDAIIDVAALTYSVKVLASGTHVPTAAEVRATAAIPTGGATRITALGVISDLEAGATGYISALAYNAAGNESPLASIAVSSTTPDVIGEPIVELIVATPNSINGLTVDVALRVVVPSGEAATLYLYLNHDATDDPAYTADPEFNLAIPAGATEATPYIVDETVDFLNYPSELGTFKALNDVRVHPTKFKIVYAKVTDASGRTSGKTPFTVRGGGGDFDASGNLKPGAIFAPSQITDGLLTLPKFDPGLRVPVFSASLPTGAPASGAVGSLVTYNGQIYKWNGSAWVNDVLAANVVGTLSAAVIPTLTASSLDPTMRIPTVVGALPGSGTSDQRVVFGGRLYKWNGSSWVDEAATANLSGQIVAGQVASGAIGAAQFAAGIQPVQIVSSIGAANPAVSFTAFNTADGLLYYRVGSSWVASTNTTLMVGQVTAGQITAGAIGTTQLAAFGVTAGKIAAGSITADKLYVSGGVGSALNADPACADPSAWIDEVTAAPPTATLTSGGVVGQTCFVSPGGGELALAGKAMIPVDANKIYRVRIWVYGNGVNGQFYSGVRMFRGDGVEVYGGGGGAFYTSHSTTIADGWTQYVGYLGTGQSATGWGWSTDFGAVGGVSCRMYALINYLGTGVGQCLVQDFRLEEVLGGTLIQDGAITTQKISVGAITADTIAANAVVFGKVAASAIGTDQLIAFSITSGKVAAGAITTDKLYVSGGFGQALNADPALTDPTAWPINGFAFVDFGTGGKSGRYGIRSNAGALGAPVGAQAIPFDVNKVYRFRLWVRRSPDANGVVYYGGTFKNGDGTDSNSNSGYCYAAGSGTAPSGSLVWQEFVGTLSVPEGSVASTARFFYPIIYLNYGCTAGFMDAQDFRVEEVLPGTLIKDGAITTAKVAALQITSDQLAANSAIFGKVAAGAIGVDQMRANSVGTDQLIAGSIRADKLIITYAPGGAINRDPMTSDASAWIIDAGPGLQPLNASGRVGPSALFSGVGTAGYYRSRETMRLDYTSKTYRIHAWVLRGGSANGVLYLGIYAYRLSDGAAVGGVYAVGGETPTNGIWVEYSRTLDASTFATWSVDPATIGDAQLYALLNYSGSTGYYYLQDFRIEEVQPGTLIKDGAITTQKLTATTVTAGVMSIASLQSISSNLGIIVSGQLTGPGGMYLDLNATGSNPVLHGTQFNLNADGTASFAGTLSAAGGSFSGSLSAATGSFAGSLSGATGTFSGSLNAASGSFTGALSGATGTFSGDVTASGSVSAGAFYSTYAQFSGRIVMRGTIRLLADAAYADAGDGGILFYRDDLGYVYGKLQMDAGTSNITLQANGSINLDSGSGANAMNISAYAVNINSNYNALATMFQVSNSTYGALFTVDVPTNNNDTGLSVIYRNESGAYSFKRIRGDNTNTGGSGNRNLRVLN